ncbi:hypothetical protein [Xanthomonas phage DES1]|nr:hypothetical protein [Xanthomonas phage DES1]
MSNNTIVLDTYATVAGRYKLVAHRKNESGVEVSRDLTPWFENLITNQGLNFIGNITVGGFLARCDVGTGNTTPTVNDTALVARTATSANLNSQTSGAATTAPYFRFCRLTFRFNTGTATGTLAEVGTGPNVSGNPTTDGLFSRSLIKDSNGNPTTVTVLADEALDVIYEYRVYPDMTEKTFNFTTRGGTAYTLTLRPYQVTAGPGVYFSMYTPSRYTSSFASGDTNRVTVNAYSDAQPDAFSDVSNFLGQSTAGSLDAYTSGNFYREGTATFDLNDANGSPIRTLVPSDIGPVSYSVGISPAVVKLSSERMSIKTRLTWGRYVP